jgi:hypothetical protein
MSERAKMNAEHEPADARDEMNSGGALGCQICHEREGG